MLSRRVTTRKVVADVRQVGGTASRKALLTSLVGWPAKAATLSRRHFVMQTNSTWWLMRKLVWIDLAGFRTILDNSILQIRLCCRSPRELFFAFK
ncbi:unnamed protein product [Protopolystoma xenopodis]|uniref:Uncharacterized protein n=1 Tax=Protopolystoma xenopodis TaxID=117903 RepID=A0A3S5A314_9PLAT|nr:unnamed protein product [Protopolystoma xenopodis]